jgi:hypothetical protein
MHGAFTGEGQDCPAHQPHTPPAPDSHADEEGDVRRGEERGEEGGDVPLAGGGGGGGGGGGSGVGKSVKRLGSRMTPETELRLFRPKEVCVKTSADGWVVGRISNGRELYVISDNKGSNLAEVHEEVERITSNYFSNIFM